MPSGVRITVALFVVAFVGVGLYYASLEGGGPPAVPEKVVRLDTPTPQLFPVVEPEPEPQPEPVVEPEPEPQPEPVVEPEPLVEEVDEIRESLGIAQRGGSMHLLADPFMSEIDGADAISIFESGNSTDGPAGTTWVRLSEWIELPDGEPSLWVIADRGNDKWVLVRDDVEGMVDLRGHVVASSDRFDTLLKQSRVTVVVDDETTPLLQELTYPNIGEDFAVVVDRRVVDVLIIRTALEARVMLAPGCERHYAKWIAARLRGDVADWPGLETTAVAEGSSAVSTEPKSIQATPPEEFQTWVIGEKDTFTSIAEAWFGETSKWTLIAHANPLVDPGRLQIGQEIRLPPKNATLAVEVAKDSHTVASGETLSDIAYAYYGAAKHWQAIYDANKSLIGEDPAALEVGMVLAMPTIPRASTPPPS